MPVAILQRTFSNFFLENFVQIAFPVFVIFALAKLNKQPKLIHEVVPHKRTLCIFGAFVAIQFVLFGLQGIRVGESIHTFGLLHGIMSFVQLLVAIWFAYAIQQLMIRNSDDVFKFLSSIVVTLAVYLFAIILPQIAITFQLPFEGWNNFWARLFERHWAERTWYDDGSYTATLLRVNGFEPEAPYLIMLLGLVFSPVLISIIQEPMTRFKRVGLLKGGIWILIGLLTVVMLMARSTSGFLMLALLAMFTFLFATKKLKMQLVVLFSVAVVALITSYYSIGSFNDMMNKWLFEKGGVDNRMGGTIGLLKTFLSHPLFGVGFGNEGFYIEQFLPEWSKHNAEYIEVYSKTAYPVLNDMLGWLARYGVAIVATALVLLGRLVIRAARVYTLLKDDSRIEAMQYRVVIRAFFIMVPMALILAMITQINAFSWPMLLMYFFYWRVILLSEEWTSGN